MLRVDDDISQLQALPQHILAQEKAITALTGQSVDQKWFVVYGDSHSKHCGDWRNIPPHLSMRKRGAYQQLPHYSAELPGAAGGRLRPAENGCPDGNKSTAKCRADGGETRSQRHAGEGR